MNKPSPKKVVFAVLKVVIVVAVGGALVLSMIPLAF
jgi:hypothetical protein